MSDSNESCGYILDTNDPETWGGQEGDKCHVRDKILNEDGVWTCPHDPVGLVNNEPRCIFHTPVSNKEAGETSEALIELLQEHKQDSPNTKIPDLQFIHAKFLKSDLKGKRFDFAVDSFKELDLSYSQINGLTNWSGLRLLSCDVYLTGVRFNNDSYFKNIEISGHLDLTHSEFRGEVHFTGSEIKSDAEFSLATFVGQADFRNMNFYAKTKFGGAKFKSPVDFFRTRFRGEAEFEWAEFSDCSFWQSKFDAYATLRGADFNGDIDFRAVNFGDKVNFKRQDNLDGANFNDANLTDADFTGASLKETNFERALLSRATLFSADLRGAKLSGAILGDIQIDGDTNFLGHATNHSNISPHTLSAIRSQLTCVYDPDYEEDNEHEDVDKARSTYRALEELGGKHARPRLQARCFVRRQDLQKQEYWDNVTGDSASLEVRLIAGARWIRAKVARVTLLYGESPWRIIGGSIAFILFVGLLYPLNEWLQPAGGEPITYTRILEGEWSLLLESLYFSTLTFTTLGMGDYEPMGVGQIIATVNTTFGAVLIALLVFVLGRRAAR